MATTQQQKQQKLQPQEVPIAFQKYKNELQQLAQKIGELESDLEEHSLVLNTLLPILPTNPDRKCYRLIGGVLVERTVKEVAPTLEVNFKGIKDVLESLVKNYKQKQEEFSGFQREYNIPSMAARG